MKSFNSPYEQKIKFKIKNEIKGGSAVKSPTSNFDKRDLSDVVEEAERDIEEPEIIHKRLKDQMFPDIKQSQKQSGGGSEFACNIKRIKTVKSLPSLKLSEMLYQRYVEHQYEDDLDKQAKEAGSDINYHRQRTDQDENFYKNKRSILKADTLQKLDAQYGYKPSANLSTGQVNISSEYLQKIESMYKLFEAEGLTLDRNQTYEPYSASKKQHLFIQSIQDNISSLKVQKNQRLCQHDAFSKKATAKLQKNHLIQILRLDGPFKFAKPKKYRGQSSLKKETKLLAQFQKQRYCKERVRIQSY
ncbi:UNKNOWN [Stylonychia lemnae]|uniref:Uncharacterized protein n=1 Tax=Stylonychia lemnae TaxID=5949 RepID=A0A078A249_STYLE|nr:UNKNOWN [Stylonychia lemnae]|eukprot:CDW76215.1 UNKNOWN [Stylonychia lemnae]